uniref:Immunoglobulin V-set domain-containing protein n=1 Tax=Terrapene triunguis TaxID=2587831 RepID=A0A674J8V2_9SAUR
MLILASPGGIGAAAQPAGWVPQLAGAGCQSDPRFLSPAGAYGQEWGVAFAPRPLDGWVGSCVTIPRSFTYPAGWTVSAVSWTRDWDQTVYHHLDEGRDHAAFKGRARYLGDLQHNCSLRVAGLHPSDQGTYRFQFDVAGEGSNNKWTSDPGQRLNVSLVTNFRPTHTPHFCLALKSKLIELGVRTPGFSPQL